MTYLAPVAPPVPVPSADPAPAILAVAEALQPDLAQGFQIDALRLRLEMERVNLEALGEIGLQRFGDGEDCGCGIGRRNRNRRRNGCEIGHRETPEKGQDQARTPSLGHPQA